MARVSLVLAIDGQDSPDAGQMRAARQALEAAGHEVEVLAATGPGGSRGSDSGPWRWVESPAPGQAPAAIEGLDQARGDVLLVLDPARGYAPSDLPLVVSALAADEAELVVGSGPEAGWRDRLARAVTGSGSPLSGLVGLTRGAFLAGRDEVRAVGSRFTLELLMKVPGRRRDVPVAPSGATSAKRRPAWDDLRHLKRLADHRFGTVSRLVQFCAVGASGMVVDLTCYAGFQWLFGRSRLATHAIPGLGALDLAAAAFLAVAIALTWNFTLNRRMTFSDVRRGAPILRQYVTYVLSNALAITLNLFVRLTLPRHIGFFDDHKLAAAVVGIVLATGVSFSMARWVVFRRAPQPPSRPERGLFASTGPWPGKTDSPARV